MSIHLQNIHPVREGDIQPFVTRFRLELTGVVNQKILSNVCRLSVYYDYKEKRARADIEEGYEAAKYYIRRYDRKNEYMIRLPPIDDCKRSYLGEIMPYPDISEADYKGTTIVNSRECNYYIVESISSRVHIYMDYEDGYKLKFFYKFSLLDLPTPVLAYMIIPAHSYLLMYM